MGEPPEPLSMVAFVTLFRNLAAISLHPLMSQHFRASARCFSRSGEKITDAVRILKKRSRFVCPPVLAGAFDLVAGPACRAAGSQAGRTGCAECSCPGPAELIELPGQRAHRRDIGAAPGPDAGRGHPARPPV